MIKIGQYRMTLKTSEWCYTNRPLPLINISIGATKKRIGDDPDQDIFLNPMEVKSLIDELSLKLKEIAP